MKLKKFTQLKNLLSVSVLLSGIFSSILVKAQTTTITFNGAAQTYTVGPGVGIIQVELWGAQGGTAGSSNGGLGGYVKGTMTVTPGEILNVYVGGQNAFNGGGTAGSGGGYISAVGGGASDIRRNGNAFTDRVVVAGGGGGAGRSTCGTQHGGIGGYPGGLGGNGDGATGGAGTLTGGGGVSGGGGCGSCCSSSRGGGGGGQAGGGAQGGYGTATGGTGGACGGNNSDYSGGCGNYTGGGGCFGLGGNGVTPSCNGGGGGGGGGWYGGGGGGANWGSGGGGGSSYVGTLTNTTITNGTRSGNGQIVITTLFDAPVVKSNVTCNGTSNGSATVTPGGVAGPYTYSWIPSGGTASVATGLSAGTYTYIVGAPSTTFISTVIITEPTALNTSASQTNVTCFGGANASASILASGGTGSYSYTWAPFGGNTASASALTAGVYTCTVKDANNCINNTLVTITQPPLLPVTASASNSVICNGSSTTLNGGGANTYVWDNGVTNNTVFSPTLTTVYTTTGTSVAGCTNTAQVTVTVNALPVITVNNGTICVGSTFTMIPGGAATFTYSNGGNTASPITGIYSYSVSGTSTAGCVSASSAVSSLTVYSIPVITVNSGTICSGKTFTMIPGGANTYTYSNGSNTVAPTANNFYFVTGTSTAGCVSSIPAISTVTVIALPVTTVNSGTICAGSTFTMIPGGAKNDIFSNGSNTVSPPVGINSYSVSGTSSVGCVNAAPAISSVTVYAIPVITVNSGTVCSGKTFTMVPGGASTYSYSNGSNMVIPTANTSYSVSGTSTAGCVSTSSAVSSVTVIALPVITVNSGSICIGSVFTMLPGGANTYTFSNGSAIVSPAITSSYAVSGTSTAGCVSTTSAISNVTVMSLPVVSISNPSAICIGATATLTAAGANSYSWNTSAITSIVTDAPLVTTSYTVTGTDLNTCKNNATATVIVNALPTVSISSPTAICVGGIAVLTATGANTYVWNTSATLASIPESPTSTTSYTVIGTDLNLCSNVASATVIVNSLPVVTIGGTTAICKGDSVLLTGNGALSYTWSTSGTTSTLYVTPASSGSYSVIGVNANGCINKATHSITVNALPVITINTSNALICEGESATLTAGGALTYVWDNNASTAMITITPSVSTTYTSIGVDANGCVNQAVYTQSVSECTGITAAGVTNTKGISVFPNPNNGTFIIATDLDLNITIRNELGQVVKTIQLDTTNKHRASVEGLANGIYFLTGAGDGQVLKTKIVVAK